MKDYQLIQDTPDNKLSIREGTKLKSGTYNAVNQQLSESPGGRVQITGAINKPDASVTLAGTPVAVHPQGGFAVEIDAAQGSNHFPLVVTEANGTVTKKFVDLQVENAVPMIHSYDLNGNLQSVAPQAAPSAPVRTYQWDAANRLVGITRIISNIETRKTELLYNGMGSRVGKTERLNGVVLSDSKMIYGATGVLQERSADGGTVLKTYAPQGEMESTNGTAIPRYYTRDHLGSIREVTASDGNVSARYDYTPYGERTRISGTYEAAKGFTGHDYLADSNFVLTRYRAYDPGLGRWLSADPIGEKGGINLFAYLLGDPVNSFDPFGLDRWVSGIGHAKITVEDPCSKETGYTQIDYGPEEWTGALRGKGRVYITENAEKPSWLITGLHIQSTPQQDAELLRYAWKLKDLSSIYNLATNNCRHFAATAKNVGMNTVLPNAGSIIPLLSSPYSPPITKIPDYLKYFPPGGFPTGY